MPKSNLNSGFLRREGHKRRSGGRKPWQPSAPADVPWQPDASWSRSASHVSRPAPLPASRRQVNTGRRWCWRRRPEVLEQLYSTRPAVRPSSAARGLRTRVRGGSLRLNGVQKRLSWDLGRSPPSLSLPVRLTPLRLPATPAKRPRTPRGAFPVRTLHNKAPPLVPETHRPATRANASLACKSKHFHIEPEPIKLA